MSIYWCGGEDIDFPVNTPSLSTDTRNFRVEYARCALSRQNVPTISVSTPFVGGGITSAWLSFRLKQSTPGYGDYSRYCGLGDSASFNKGIYVGCVTNGTKLALYKFDGVWTTLATSDSLVLPAGSYKLDMELVNYGENATVRLYVNGVCMLTYTGDVSLAGVSFLDCVCLGPVTNFSCFLSEIIVSSTDTRILSLKTYVPLAAGDTNTWTGAHTDIDETVISDADTVYVDSTAQDAQFNLSATPAGTFAVDAIRIVARACKTVDAAVGTVALGVKSGGIVDVDAGHALTTAWATYERLTPTINGAQLTTALLDALQLNLRSAA